MYKLGCLDREGWVEHRHAPVFLEETTREGRRLTAGVPGGDPRVLSRLVSTLEPLFAWLYVLHTPRGEGMAGRYRKPVGGGR